MGLSIQTIECENFRSYQKFRLDGIGVFTLIVGPNATGKTNLLEGIQFTTACSSFRNPRVEHLIRDGEERGWFKSVIEGDGRLLEVELRATQEGRSFFLNGKKKRAHDLRGTLPSVLFCPDDLNLIKGPQSVKRAQLDALGSQVSANYHTLRRDYEKILRQKNSCLKQDMPHEYLLSVNEVLASIGSQLYYLRTQLVASLIPYIQDFYNGISLGREEVHISYIPSWERAHYDPEQYVDRSWYTREQAQSMLLESMEKDYRREHERHMSLYGPQVDRVEFYLNGKNASVFASQGQQRSLVLSYKMAEVAFIREKIGQSPLLLLDDVMSELDADRRKALFSLLSEGIQTFMTATNAEILDGELAQQAQVVELDLEGRVHCE